MCSRLGAWSLPRNTPCGCECSTNGTARRPLIHSVGVAACQLAYCKNGEWRRGRVCCCEGPAVCHTTTLNRHGNMTARGSISPVHE